MYQGITYENYKIIEEKGSICKLVDKDFSLSSRTIIHLIKKISDNMQ